MASIFTSNWENGTVLDSIWDSETGSGALSNATDQFLQATHALKYNSATSPQDYIQKAITGVGTIGERIGIRINAISGSPALACIRSASGAGNMVYLASDGAGGIGAYNVGTAAFVGTTYVYTLNTWYQVEIKFVNGTSISWRVWDATGTTLVKTEQTSTTSIPASNCDMVQLGMMNNPGGTSTFWYDAFAADNAGYVGPYLSTILGGVLKCYDGSKFNMNQLKEDDSGTWTRHRMKRWDGSQWQLIDA